MRKARKSPITEIPECMGSIQGGLPESQMQVIKRLDLKLVVNPTKMFTGRMVAKGGMEAQGKRRKSPLKTEWLPKFNFVSNHVELSFSVITTSHD